MHWPRQLYSNGGYTGQGDFTGTVDHWLRGLHSDGVGGDTSLVSAQGSSPVGGGAETSLSSLFCMTAQLLLLSFHVTDR